MNLSGNDMEKKGTRVTLFCAKESHVLCKCPDASRLPENILATSGSKHSTIN